MCEHIHPPLGRLRSEAKRGVLRPMSFICENRNLDKKSLLPMLKRYEGKKMDFCAVGPPRRKPRGRGAEVKKKKARAAADF